MRVRIAQANLRVEIPSMDTSSWSSANYRTYTVADTQSYAMVGEFSIQPVTPQDTMELQRAFVSPGMHFADITFVSNADAPRSPTLPSVSVSITNVEQVRRLIDTLLFHEDELPPDLKEKLMEVLDAEASQANSTSTSESTR